MKNKYLRSRLFLIVIFAFSMTYGQKNESPWTKITKNSISQNRVVPQNSSPIKASYYELNMEVLKSNLQKAPQKNPEKKSSTLLDFPNADGAMETFTIMEYSVMDPELQAKFPHIRSYVGYSLKNASTAIYFSISPDGLHTMSMSSDRGTEYINPYTSDGAYEAFSRSAIPVSQNLFECGVIEDGLSRSTDFDMDFKAASNTNDGMLRTFRLAIGTSMKYTDFHGGTVAGALAAINTTMTRVNGIYERELSIRMILVANNNLLISTDTAIFPDTDNISASTGIINMIIGVEDYDIGHYFTRGAGGRAYLNSVCNSNKGGGVTGTSQPIGDPFNVDFVTHEMGHQFGATHTFNGTLGNCDSGNRTEYTAYEPGSGSTIMAYAGICGSQNLELNSSDYFHQASLQQIWANITTGNSTCGVKTATGNAAPTANAGASYNIPISTPYKLTGSSTDADGTGTHTFTWEQFDLGPAGMPTETTQFGPMVRSFQGTRNTVRYIPRLKDVVANGGTSTTWEKLASVGRALNFALTVRDNDPRGGQTAVDAMTVATIATAGPFKVTSQSSNTNWEIGSNKTVTWDVANTNVAPVNTQNVNIKLSIDGGLTFPHTLASNVPNDGAHEILVPNVTITNEARIIVEGADNIFYNVNTSNFKIISVDFLLNFSPSSVMLCHPNDAVYNFVYNTYGGYNQVTTFSASSLPAGTTATFNPTTATADGTPITMTVSGSANVSPGDYVISATGTSGSLTTTSPLSLSVFNNNVSTATLISPVNGVASLDPEVTFIWDDDVNTQDYLIEVSTTNNFSNIVASATVANTTFTASLQEATTYYWRVTGSNQCANAAAFVVNTFSTYLSSCDMYTAADTPITILTTGDNQVYNSVIAVTQDFSILDVNVKVNMIHTWIRDLRLVLISPTGTQIVLIDNKGNSSDENFTNTIFDQEASTSILEVSAPFTGSFVPEGDLSQLYGEMSTGDWTLQVTDLYDGDGGSLDEFTLELCLAKPLAIEEPVFEAFKIFPNPNNGEFTVKLQSHSVEAIRIHVYDIRGRKVFENRFENTSNFREVIRLNNAQSGMYLITITDGLTTVTERILVE